MKKLIFGLLTCVLLAGCGGDNTITSPPSTGDTPTPTTTISSVTVLTSSPQLPSDNSAPVTITAYVLNAANQAMADVIVVFQTDSGYLTGIQSVTDEDGVATATLNTLASDPTNRTITVTATAGSLSDAVDVSVVGTQLALTGSANIVQGTQSTYTATLTNAGSDPIVGKTVVFSSSSGNGLSATSVVTDSNGQAVVTLTGTNAGADTLTAAALGSTAQQAITVTNDNFAFTTPTANTEIALGQTATVAVVWTIGGVAQQNETINFSTTRGTLSSAADDTDAAGQATVIISSTNAGTAVITATTDTGTTVQRTIEFVATTPSTINLQASPTTVSTSEQSTITAVVRDAANNLVKNKTVQFTLSDVTGGTLSVGSAVTDSQGRAQTIYTASSVTSAASGVTIAGVVQGTSPTVQSSTTLTVARREVFISLGTGNELEELNAAQYSLPYAIQVTDSNGNGVANTPLTVRVISLWYGLGERDWDGSTHDTNYVDVCLDEDSLLPGTTSYRNGILDSGEDVNTSTRLEAGNIATVTPSTVTTDSNGFALIEVVYPQEYAYWVKVELSASATVQGTESVRSVAFQLPGTADDFNEEDTAPPGETSPFGSTFIKGYDCPAPSSSLFP